MTIPKRPGYFKGRRDLHGIFSTNAATDWHVWTLYIFLVEQSNWADSATLKDGQLSMSLDEMSIYTDRSKMQVKRHLNILKHYDLIEILMSGSSHKPSVIYVKKGVTKSDTKSDTKCDTKSVTNKDLDIFDEFDDLDTKDVTKSDTKCDTKSDLLLIKRRSKEKKRGEEDKDKKNSSSLSVPVPATSKMTYEILAEEWNVKLPHHVQNQIPLLRKNEKRKAVITAAIESFGIETLSDAISAIARTEFLCGKNDRNWRPDFMWIMKAENLQKIAEGKYGDKKVSQCEKLPIYKSED